MEKHAIAGLFRSLHVELKIFGMIVSAINVREKRL